MLSIYLIPAGLRPVDFCKNLPRYVIGFISYMLMLPVFVNIMQVYAMSNLHDVSWGNRPTANAGTNQLTINEKKSEELQSNFKVFRINFLAFWVLSNLAFALVIENFATTNAQS